MGHCMTLPLICCFPFFFSSPCLACHSARWCLCASASVCVCLCRDNGNEINHIHETTTKKKKAANEKSVAVEHKKLVRQRAFLRAQKVPWENFPNAWADEKSEESLMMEALLASVELEMPPWRNTPTNPYLLPSLSLLLFGPRYQKARKTANERKKKLPRETRNVAFRGHKKTARGPMTNDPDSQ